MSNPISTVMAALVADIRYACDWTTEEVFFSNPRTQPDSRSYAISRLVSMQKRDGRSSSCSDQYDLQFVITIRLEDTDLSLIRFDRRAEVWLKLREKLTPLADEHGGSSAYNNAFSPSVEEGNLNDFNTPEEPDTELSLTFKCTILLERGRSNIT